MEVNRVSPEGTNLIDLFNCTKIVAKKALGIDLSIEEEYKDWIREEWTRGNRVKASKLQRLLDRYIINFGGE